MNFILKCVLGAIIGGTVGLGILYFQSVQEVKKTTEDLHVLEQIANDDVVRYQQEGVTTK